LTAENLVDGEAVLHATYQWDIVIKDDDFFKEGAGGKGLYFSPKRDLGITYFGIHGEGENEHQNLNNLNLISRQLTKSGLFDM
jgi:hypothetical protein